MATVPVTRTWVAGEVVTAGYMNNNITAVLNWLLAPAICQVRQIVAQSIANGGTGTNLTFTAEDVDTTGMHSTSSNTSRLTAVYPGWYFANATPSYAANTAGVRGGAWRVNGATTLAGINTFIAATISATLCVPCRPILLFLNVGDYIEIAGYQTSGAGLNTVVTTGEQPSCTVFWVSN